MERSFQSRERLPVRLILFQVLKLVFHKPSISEKKYSKNFKSESFVKWCNRKFINNPELESIVIEGTKHTGKTFAFFATLISRVSLGKGYFVISDGSSLKYVHGETSSLAIFSLYKNEFHEC